MQMKQCRALRKTSGQNPGRHAPGSVDVDKPHLLPLNHRSQLERAQQASSTKIQHFRTGFPPCLIRAKRIGEGLDLAISKRPLERALVWECHNRSVFSRSGLQYGLEHTLRTAQPTLLFEKENLFFH